MSTDPRRRSYRPGGWFGIFGDNASVLLPPSEKARVAAIWELVDDGAGFDEVLDALLATGLRDLPGFVLVSDTDQVTKVVLRGPAVAAFVADGAMVELAGSSETTWVERTLSGVSQLFVQVEPTEDDAGEDMVITTGLVRLARVEDPPYRPRGGARVDDSRAADGPSIYDEDPLGMGLDEEPILAPGLDPDETADPLPLAYDEASDGYDESPAEPVAEAVAEDGPETYEHVGEALGDDAAADEQPFEAPVEEQPFEASHDEPQGFDAPAEDQGFGEQGFGEQGFGEQGFGEQGFDEPVTEVLPTVPPPIWEPAAPTAAMPEAPPIWQPPAGAPPAHASETPAPDGPTQAGPWNPQELGLTGPRHTPPGAPVLAQPVARLHFSSGETVDVDRVVLVGRAPEPRRFALADQPRLVPVPSPHQEISSTHLEVRPGVGADQGTAVVTDLGSTNGTVLVQPGLPPEDLTPGIAVQLLPGAVIDLGDGVTIQVTTP